ncbi:hypothetical protein F4823DRAFT_271277 [Ustulina deusta]|nr:hypothetical protein F4823DRAFT_271277 [Ustulina deusta]
MAPYINSPGKGEYSGFRICTSQKMPPLLNSYVTTFVELTLGDEMSAERRTSMRYRDMMVDNYLAAGGDLKTWRCIGTNGISNEPTSFLIEECFLERGGDFTQPGSVEFLPNDEEFASVTLGNPFTRGIRGFCGSMRGTWGRRK